MTSTTDGHGVFSVKISVLFKAKTFYISFLGIWLSTTPLTVLFPVSSWVWAVSVLLALWLVTVLCNMRCLSHNLICFPAVPGRVILKYSICWCFQFIRKSDLMWPMNWWSFLLFYKQNVPSAFSRDILAWCRNILEFSSVICNHREVCDSFFSINGLQNLQICRLKSDLCSLTWVLSALGGKRKMLDSQELFLSFPLQAEYWSGFIFPFSKNTSFSKPYRLEEWKTLYLPIPVAIHYIPRQA